MLEYSAAMLNLQFWQFALWWQKSHLPCNLHSQDITSWAGCGSIWTLAQVHVLSVLSDIPKPTGEVINCKATSHWLKDRDARMMTCILTACIAWLQFNFWQRGFVLGDGLAEITFCRNQDPPWFACRDGHEPSSWALSPSEMVSGQYHSWSDSGNLGYGSQPQRLSQHSLLSWPYAYNESASLYQSGVSQVPAYEIVLCSTDFWRWMEFGQPRALRRLVKSSSLRILAIASVNNT